MESEYIDYPTALRILGASKATLLNRIRAFGVATYTDASDRRRRLIALDDVMRMANHRSEPVTTFSGRLVATRSDIAAAQAAIEALPERA